MLVGLLAPQQYYTANSYRLNAPIVNAYLARRLADYDIDVQAMDLAGLQVYENAILDGLDQFDAIGISAMSNQAEGARRLIKLIRYHEPKKYIVVGGVDPTLDPNKYLEWGADAAVTGQADGNVAEVFLSQPTGVIEGKPGRIDGRPLWEKHAPQPWEYPGHAYPLALPESLVMATRGCPFACAMCGNVIWGRQRVRRREVPDVVDELEWLKFHGVRGVFWYDDEIVDRENLSYLYSIIKETSGLVYRAQGRCNIREDQAGMMEALRRHGVVRVMWGVESFSDKVLEALNKKTTQEDILRTLKISADAGMQNYLFLMTGNPEETPEEAKLTYDMTKMCLEQGLAHMVQVMPLALMPGTPLRERAIQEGWFFEGDPFQGGVVGGTPWMSQVEIADHTAAMWALSSIYKGHDLTSTN